MFAKYDARFGLARMNRQKQFGYAFVALVSSGAGQALTVKLRQCLPYSVTSRFGFSSTPMKVTRERLCMYMCVEPMVRQSSG
jgi:hypothetical protein